MVIGPGTHVGPYKVTALLGEGGMGKVWRARHTGLERDDALKVLPDVFAADPERLARFQREARVLASLNHPNIARIYGLEETHETGGTTAIVMELVEGPTLADRIAQGPIPVEEALSVAKQIAEALEAAHEQGIIHRDLKPANVKAPLDGPVRVLDFGLAKPLDSARAALDPSQSPTLSMPPMTQVGVILGTAAYVSPEQARGKAVDTRADIWAFGCVLYEALTASLAFPGETFSDTIAAILEREPKWSALPEQTPAGIRRLLHRCLEKDPKRRLRDIGEARIELGDAIAARGTLRDTREGRVALGERTEVATASRPRHALWAVTTAALLALALAGWWQALRPVSRPLVRLPVELGPEAVDPINGAGAILSPDGTRLVYRSRNAGGAVQLVMRTLDQEQATPLAGTEDAIGPFFSPDGRSVGFFDMARRKLRKISLQQGPPVDLSDAEAARGGSWGEDGNIIAAITARGPLYRIPSGGGRAEPITVVQPAVTHRWPQVLPGAEAVVFTANEFIGDFDRATIEIQSLRTGQRKTLIQGGHYGRYIPTGHLLYVRGGTLHALPLDVRRQELTGPAVPVISSVRNRISSGGAAYDVSSSGTLICAGGAPVTYRLAWLDDSGRVERLPARASQYNFPIRFSPDGRRLALATAEAGSLDVWVYDWQRDAWTRLTSSPDVDSHPVWSPSGTHLALESGRGIFWRRADGTGEAVRLTADDAVPHPFSFSPNGDWLAFTRWDSQTKEDVWALPLERTESDHPRAGAPVPLLKTTFNEDAPMISPDGRWMAYQSNESGRDEVYVQSFPVGGGRWPISTGGGSRPVWARRGQRLFYRSPEGVMVASYSVVGAAFEPGTARVWVKISDLGEWFDLSPDGTRFVAVENAPDAGQPTHVTFLLNFFDELRRSVPRN